MVGQLTVFETLLEILAEEKNRTIQWAAMSGLNAIKDPKVITFWFKLAIKFPSEGFYHAAIRNFGTTGNDSALKELEFLLLNNNNLDLRVHATLEETIYMLKYKLSRSAKD